MTPEQQAAVAPAAKAAVQHVAVTGISWGAIFTLLGVIVNVVIGGALAKWIQTRPKMKELEQTAETTLIDTLTKRVETLERKLDEKDAKHEAEVSLLRHQVKNSDGCLDALLMMLEGVTDLPERAKDAIRAAMAMRAQQRDREAMESATMRGAAMARRTA